MPAVQRLTYPGRVFVRRTVLDTIRREAGRFVLRETGGVLFGYRAGGDIVVTAATGPGPAARHSYHWFEPDTRYCQRLLEAAYHESGGVVTYQGDWHTHPWGGTDPSAQDRGAMTMMAQDPDTRQPAPLLWIHRPGCRLLRARTRDAIWVLDTGQAAWLTTVVEWVEEERGA